MVKTTTVTQTHVIEEVITNMPRKRVGIMGGTFNPIHNGHLLAAEQMATQLGLDAVLFIPDANPPHVDTKFAIGAKDRVAMVALAIEDNPLFRIDLTEVQRGGKSYSIDTVKTLKERHPETDYYFFLGADMANYLPTWHKIDELVKLVNFVAVKRPGYDEQSPYPIIWVDSPQLAISSTLIRRKVHEGQSVRYLVPEKVRQYMEAHQLYD